MGDYRAMVKSPTRMGMNPEIELNQGIHEHFLKYKARGEKMPVALMLGAPPAITFASVHKLPKHLDELAVARRPGERADGGSARPKPWI